MRPGIRNSGRQPLDMGPALAELVLDPLEAAVEMINPANDGLSLGGEPSDDERHRGAQICRHDLRAEQAVDAGDKGGIALELNTGPEPSQFLAMHMSAMSWACKSVGKPGKGWVSTETGFRPTPFRATRMPVGRSSTSTPDERKI
jgi:hypothetical protein